MSDFIGLVLGVLGTLCVVGGIFALGALVGYESGKDKTTARQSAVAYCGSSCADGDEDCYKWCMRENGFDTGQKVEATQICEVK